MQTMLHYNASGTLETYTARNLVTHVKNGLNLSKVVHQVS